MELRLHRWAVGQPGYPNLSNKDPTFTNSLPP